MQVDLSPWARTQWRRAATSLFSLVLVACGSGQNGDHADGANAETSATGTATETGDGDTDGHGDGDGDGDPLEIPPPLGPEAMTPTQLLTIAELPGLFSRHRDVAMVCEYDATTISPEETFPVCDVARVDADGGVTLLGMTDVRNAQRLAGDYLLIVRQSLDMVVTDNDGIELRSLGRSFVSPHVLADGLRVLALAYPAEVTSHGTSMLGHIERIHAFTGERELLVDDPGAYAPHEVPGTDQILFVSGRSGLASLWLREPNGTEVQLSNRATTYVGTKAWAPVPIHELTWIPDDPTRAIYAAVVDDQHELWVLDTVDGRAERVGVGRMPARGADGRLLVIAPDKSGPRVVALPNEVLP